MIAWIVRRIFTNTSIFLSQFPNSVQSKKAPAEKNRGYFPKSSDAQIIQEHIGPETQPSPEFGRQNRKAPRGPNQSQAAQGAKLRQIYFSCTSSMVPMYLPFSSRTAMYITLTFLPFFFIGMTIWSFLPLWKSEISLRTIGSTRFGWHS